MPKPIQLREILGYFFSSTLVKEYVDADRSHRYVSWRLSMMKANTHPGVFSVASYMEAREAVATLLKLQALWKHLTVMMCKT